MTQVERIEILGKRLHQFAEAFEMACKAGDALGVSEIIGCISQIIPQLRILAKTIHDRNQPRETLEQFDGDKNE